MTAASLLYRAVLLSALQHSDSVSCIHTSPPTWACLPLPSYPTHLGHHRASSWTTCAIQQVPTSCLFSTWEYIYVNLNPLIGPALPSPPPPQSTCPFSMSAFKTTDSRFQPYLQNNFTENFQLFSYITGYYSLPEVIHKIQHHILWICMNGIYIIWMVQDSWA